MADVGDTGYGVGECAVLGTGGWARDGRGGGDGGPLHAARAADAATRMKERKKETIKIHLPLMERLAVLLPHVLVEAQALALDAWILITHLVDGAFHFQHEGDGAAIGNARARHDNVLALII